MRRIRFHHVLRAVFIILGVSLVMSFVGPAVGGTGYAWGWFFSCLATAAIAASVVLLIPALKYYDFL